MSALVLERCRLELERVNEDILAYETLSMAPGNSEALADLKAKLLVRLDRRDTLTDAIARLSADEQRAAEINKLFAELLPDADEQRAKD